MNNEKSLLIIDQLLNSKEPLKADKLADSLKLSRRTVFNYMKSVKNGFSSYKIKNLFTKVNNIAINDDYAVVHVTETGEAETLKPVEGIDGNEGAMNPDIPKIYNEYMDEGRVVAQMNQYLDTLQPLFGNTIWVYYLEAPSKGNMDGKAVLDRFQEDVNKFMTEKGAEGWK